MKNLFRFSCIFFKIILYKYKYCYFIEDDSYERKQKYEIKNILKNKKK